MVQCPPLYVFASSGLDWGNLSAENRTSGLSSAPQRRLLPISDASSGPLLGPCLCFSVMRGDPRADAEFVSRIFPGMVASGTTLPSRFTSWQGGRPILSFLCPRPGISGFSEEPWFRLVGNGVQKPRPGCLLDWGPWSVAVPTTSPLGHTLTEGLAVRSEEISCLHVYEGGARLFLDGVLAGGPCGVPPSMALSLLAWDARWWLLCFA